MIDLLLELAGWALLVIVAWIGLGFIGSAWYWWLHGRAPRQDDPKRGY